MVTFMLQLLYARGKVSSTQWIRSCVCPIAGLDMVAKRKVSAPEGTKMLAIHIIYSTLLTECS
jgi:hypothetical protein